MTLSIVLLQGPWGIFFHMSEVPLYHSTALISRAARPAGLVASRSNLHVYRPRDMCAILPIVSHPTLNPKPSTCTQPQVNLYPQPSTLNPQPYTLHP